MRFLFHLPTLPHIYYIYMLSLRQQDPFQYRSQHRSVIPDMIFIRSELAWQTLACMEVGRQRGLQGQKQLCEQAKASFYKVHPTCYLLSHQMSCYESLYGHTRLILIPWPASANAKCSDTGSHSYALRIYADRQVESKSIHQRKAHNKCAVASDHIFLLLLIQADWIYTFSLHLTENAYQKSHTAGYIY